MTSQKPPPVSERAKKMTSLQELKAQVAAMEIKEKKEAQAHLVDVINSSEYSGRVYAEPLKYSDTFASVYEIGTGRKIYSVMDEREWNQLVDLVHVLTTPSAIEIEVLAANEEDCIF
jgi:hypothetical protein